MAYDQGIATAEKAYHDKYASSAGMTTAALQRDRNPDSFASTAEQAHAQTGAFVQRLSMLTDRLCGGTPPDMEPNSGQIRGLPNGHFEEAADNCRSILMKLEAANRCLDRIERALP